MAPELMLMALVSTSTRGAEIVAKCSKPSTVSIDRARAHRLLLEDVSMYCKHEDSITLSRDLLDEAGASQLRSMCDGWVADADSKADGEWVKKQGELVGLRHACVLVNAISQNKLKPVLSELDAKWRAWRSKTGPANLRWGMTPADVKRIFPRAKPKEDDILVVDRAELAEVPARVVLRFARGRFYGADFEALDQEGNRGVTFQDWFAGLTAKYGEHTYANDAETEYVFQDPETYATLDVVRVFSFGMARVKYQSRDLTRWVQRVERERLEKKAQGM